MCSCIVVRIISREDFIVVISCFCAELSVEEVEVMERARDIPEDALRDVFNSSIIICAINHIITMMWVVYRSFTKLRH